jgi:nucleoside-diphosphate-sugar epimerase
MILITGATGYIGQHLVNALRQRNAKVCTLVRDLARIGQVWPEGAVEGRYGDLAKPETLNNVCKGIDTVFHLASYAQNEDKNVSEHEELHWSITVTGTQALLAEAARKGVKRFIFLSTVKVMGEGGATCLDESSLVAPKSSYGRAKLAAERLVLEAGEKHGMHVCNLRLPMVYGLDYRGNLARMIASINSGWFPPLPEVNNKRSLVHVDDVIQALLLAEENPVARNKTYIVTDSQVYSTRHIYTLVCQALGKPVPRRTIPVTILRLGSIFGDIIGRVTRRPMPLNSQVLEKLLGSAWYSSEKISRELGYHAQHTLETGLHEMVESYKRTSRA